jgi:RHH-type proline utilization regulon transcriptional repressor/proline dehydrogenase/delta 1-pyrroline-5-carboxylate dehydrogenase
LPAGAAPGLTAFLKGLGAGRDELAKHLGGSRFGAAIELKGPVGERNIYSLVSRGAVLCDASTESALIAQIACALSAGSRAFLKGPAAAALLASLPASAKAGLTLADAQSHFEAVLTDREGDALVAFQLEIARRDGPIASVFRVDAETPRRHEAPIDLLLGERSLCINTTAAGGNASLMSIG